MRTLTSPSSFPFTSVVAGSLPAISLLSPSPKCIVFHYTYKDHFHSNSFAEGAPCIFPQVVPSPNWQAVKLNQATYERLLNMSISHLLTSRPRNQRSRCLTCKKYQIGSSRIYCYHVGVPLCRRSCSGWTCQCTENLDKLAADTQ